MTDFLWNLAAVLFIAVALYFFFYEISLMFHG